MPVKRVMHFGTLQTLKDCAFVRWNILRDILQIIGAKNDTSYFALMEFYFGNGNRRNLYAHRGMTYIIPNDMSIHRSKTTEGVQLIIIDGDFLK